MRGFIIVRNNNNMAPYVDAYNKSYHPVPHACSGSMHELFIRLDQQLQQQRRTLLLLLL